MSTSRFPESEDSLELSAGLQDLARRFDLSVRLSSDELVELTERALEFSELQADDAGHVITLEGSLSLLESSHVSQAALERAVESLLENRERRLSNVMAVKAHEMERLLLSLLPRLDVSFQSNSELELPRGGRVVYQLRSSRGRFGVRVRHAADDLIWRTLFTIDVRSSRRPHWLERLLGRQRPHAKRVDVRAPAFGGTCVEDLLNWILKRKSTGSSSGLAAGFAVENLTSAVVAQVEEAMRFVSTLSFDSD